MNIYKESDFFFRWAKILQPKTDKILQTYKKAKAESRDDCSDKLFEKFDSIFFGDSNVTVDKAEILSYIIKMSNEFQRFALMQR
jgi:hypothetical protein